MLKMARLVYHNSWKKAQMRFFWNPVYRNMTISRRVQTSNLKFVSSSLRKTNFIAKSLFIEDMG